MPSQHIIRREFLSLSVNQQFDCCSQCNKIYLPAQMEWYEVHFAYKCGYISNDLKLANAFCDACAASMSFIADSLYTV